MEYSVTFCIQSEKIICSKYVRHGQVYINLGNVFAEGVHFLFSIIREYCREFFQLKFKPKFVCLRSMLAPKMLSKWHVIKIKYKIQTKTPVRNENESR